MLICEELFLLLRRNDGKPESAFAQNGYGLAAAVITDLIVAGAVTLSDDKDPRVSIVAGTSAAHPAIAAAGERLTEKDGTKLSSLVTDGKLNVEQQVGEALMQQGVVGFEDKRALGLIAAKYPEVNPTPERELRQRLSVVLAGGTPAVADASLLSILQGLDLVTKVLKDEVGELSKKQVKQRIEDVSRELEEVGEVGQAIAHAVEMMNAAIMSAVFVTVIVPSAT